MTREEFNQHSGLDIKAEYYAPIERVYMSASDEMDKVTFGKAYGQLFEGGCKDDALDLVHDLSDEVRKWKKYAHEQHNRAEAIMADKRVVDSRCDAQQSDLDELDARLVKTEGELSRTIDAAQEMAALLLKLGREDELREMVGVRAVIKVKLSRGIELTAADREAILEMLQG